MYDKEQIYDRGIGAYEFILGGPPVKQDTRVSAWRCPLHDDKEPSLHVNKKEGKWLWNCSPCGKGGDVLYLAHRVWGLALRGPGFRKIMERLGKGLGLDDREVKLAKDPRVGRFIPWEERQGLKAIYRYTDEQGNLLFEKARFEQTGGKKTFEQRAPKEEGGWNYRTAQVKRVLYNLRALAAEPSKMVVVVEGEKDVDSLSSSRILATTTPDGAGTWKPEYNDHFVGRDVLVIADNDEAGEKHARRVATEVFPGANEVRILNPAVLTTDAPKGYDITDYMADNGGTLAFDKNNLLEWWQKATPFDNTATMKDALSAYGIDLETTDDVLEANDPPTQHVWAECMPTSGISILASGPGVGKSTLSRGLALAVARGEDFVGQPTLGGPVLLFYLEEDRAEIRKHLRLLGLAKGDRVYLPHLEDRESYHEGLKKSIELLKPALVVIDPMQEFLGIREINSYAETNEKLVPLREMARESGAHILILHHTSKMTDWILGSQALKGTVDSAFIMKKAGGGLRVWEPDKVRIGKPFEPMALVFDEATRSMRYGGNAEDAMDLLLAEKIVGILEREGRDLTRNEIIEATGADRNLVWRTLSKNPKGMLERIPSRSTVAYRVRSGPPPEEEGTTWQDSL